LSMAGRVARRAPAAIGVITYPGLGS
jgi:hypothetical protein